MIPNCALKESRVKMSGIRERTDFHSRGIGTHAPSFFFFPISFFLLLLSSFFFFLPSFFLSPGENNTERNIWTKQDPGCVVTHFFQSREMGGENERNLSFVSKRCSPFRVLHELKEAWVVSVSLMKQNILFSLSLSVLSVLSWKEKWSLWWAIVKGSNIASGVN